MAPSSVSTIPVFSDGRSLSNTPSGKWSAIAPNASVTDDVPGSLGGVFEQKVAHIDVETEAFDHQSLAAGAEIIAFEFAATQMHADDELGRGIRQPPD